MQQFQQTIRLDTSGQSLLEFTRKVAKIVADSGIQTGVVHVYCRHTSASLLIQENADPDVQRDLLAFFQRLVPDGDPLFIHRSEGPDDMPAHIKTALTQTALAIPIAQGAMLLGTWQGIYLFEHRIRPHTRSIVVHVMGD
ncbi:secondary thiamine-phosphate synthase enzyme YjbQ [Hyphomicrobium sp.]|jgi:secondary thiamine-phosphate synthase enzyme|uniref:secondary thiamine-phosphate synthase enzyme YjbQ n=1 Tax=Hyphomicrobium sp. TaxID=82 RepID=UPI002B9CAB05|nr:secondary thiamine-phosphate synthase enzyme YjbQ [Hyphomicrobium sp.]HVZ05372.1 secondary thiamine-phosphate synthase enzyme YjbQ [Hyphomicrobium sp.]